MTDTRGKRRDGIRTLADIRGRCWVDDETDCWLWRGAMSNTGAHKTTPATRVWLPSGLRASDGCGIVTTAGKAAWLLSGRKLPDGHVVWRHLCVDTHCINPKHAAAGSRREMHTALAASNRLKGNPKRAVVNAINRASTLTPVGVVRQAEAMFADQAMQKDICAALGLQSSTAKLIRLGRHPNSAGRQHLVANASVFSWRPAA